MTRKWGKLNSAQPPSKNSIQRFLPSQRQRLEVQSFLYPLKPPLGQGGGRAAAPVPASEGPWLFDSALLSLLSCSTTLLSCSPQEGLLLIVGVTASSGSSRHSFLGTKSVLAFPGSHEHCFNHLPTTSGLSHMAAHLFARYFKKVRDCLDLSLLDFLPPLNIHNTIFDQRRLDLYIITLLLPKVYCELHLKSCSFSLVGLI